jgi:hypothetical protein
MSEKKLFGKEDTGKISRLLRAFNRAVAYHGPEKITAKLKALGKQTGDEEAVMDKLTKAVCQEFECSETKFRNPDSSFQPKVSDARKVWVYVAEYHVDYCDININRIKKYFNNVSIQAIYSWRRDAGERFTGNAQLSYKEFNAKLKKIIDLFDKTTTV